MTDKHVVRVTVEGPGGAGKTILAQLLYEGLHARGVEVAFMGTAAEENARLAQHPRRPRLEALRTKSRVEIHEREVTP